MIIIFIMITIVGSTISTCMIDSMRTSVLLDGVVNATVLAPTDFRATETMKTQVRGSLFTLFGLNHAV